MESRLYGRLSFFWRKLNLRLRNNFTYFVSERPNLVFPPNERELFCVFVFVLRVLKQVRMEMKGTAAKSALDIPVGNKFPETQVIVQNGAETQLRVTLNNDINGVVEVEFQELYEVPFRYPLQHV